MQILAVIAIGDGHIILLLWWILGIQSETKLIALEVI